MAGATQIGTGAVVLTANADALLTGLDKAKRHTEKFAASTSRKLGAKGAAGAAPGGGPNIGGFGGGVFVGGIGGAIAGVALKGATLLAHALGKIPEILSDMRERAERYANVSLVRNAAIDRAASAVDRIDSAWDDAVLTVGAALAPALERIASIVEVIGFVAASAIGEFIDSMSEAVTQALLWLDATLNLGAASESTADVIFALVKGAAMGFAWLWDTVKAGAGIVVGTFGVMVRGVADFLDLIGQTNDGIRKLANGMTDFGGAALAGFGTSAAQVEGWLDRLQAKFKTTERLAKKITGPNNAAAMLRGSQEAASTMLRFQTANILNGAEPADNPVKIAKEQLKEAKEAKRVLWKIVGVLDQGTLIQVVP